MDRDFDGWWRNRLIAAVFSGIAGYLRASHSSNPQFRRTRFVWLVLPALTQLIVRFSKPEKKVPEEKEAGTISLLPVFALMLGTVAYWVYIFRLPRSRRS